MLNICIVTLFGDYNMNNGIRDIYNFLNAMRKLWRILSAVNFNKQSADSNNLAMFAKGDWWRVKVPIKGKRNQLLKKQIIYIRKTFFLP